jgi:hypothetical protein
LARAHRAQFARAIASAAARGDSSTGPDRGALGAFVAVCAFVRDGLVRAGVDPARARALCQAPFPPPAAAAAASAIPGDRRSAVVSEDDQAEEVGEFVVKDADGLAAIFTERLGALVRRYEDGHEPDFANASLAELLAWCLARAEDRV